MVRVHEDMNKPILSATELKAKTLLSDLDTPWNALLAYLDIAEEQGFGEDFARNVFDYIYQALLDFEVEVLTQFTLNDSLIHFEPLAQLAAAWDKYRARFRSLAKNFPSMLGAIRQFLRELPIALDCFLGFLGFDHEIEKMPLWNKNRLIHLKSCLNFLKSAPVRSCA
jgi:hypothetical protein